ncbi:MAG: segregation/condensation protein A [Rhizomicrobium sp.]
MSATDFVTFRSLDQCPMAMTAHVVYDAIDPQRPATTSPKMIRDVIRGEMGFDGLLMSDDVSMSALSGPISARAKAALFAGCDVVLHCNGNMTEMRDVAEEAKPLDGVALRRAEHALALLVTPESFDPDAASAHLADLMKAAAMNEIVEPFENFEAITAPDDALLVAVDGFEGPLDLLLSLARNQKVDIAKISVLDLADQYLLFVESARGRNLELSADYLVMAAWLAFLKSKLILPQPPSENGEPTADELAARLRWRLQRLEAMRRASTRLMGRERAGPRRLRPWHAGACEGREAPHPYRYAL